jgi:cell division GTPase FtsZ
MRIIAIGLGGAGSRIVDRLFATDRRNSKVACVQSFAVDVDEKTLRDLKGLPDNAKIFFPAMDPAISDHSGNSNQTATIDINEIISKVQNLESGETDAIFISCGLGGSMVDIAPHVIARLRSSVVEPIFGLVTLPCLSEGVRRSGKAADDIEMLGQLLDGIILFDNETWFKKVKSEMAHLTRKEIGFAEKLGLKKAEPPLSPAQATYLLLNEAIVRRISLILRAGEFKADGGIDLAEVVLDSGEVLNTMKGMGFITIGYAVERLAPDPFSFLSRIKPGGINSDEHQKKASRIVELAKQAIYHEISTPCDMTSAHKALILVAGPSHEISMKGFMTVRKWIDRSIAGLETRSGDYPVMNTKNVAIIIMLSGLENIPRITELMEIRAQLQSKQGTETLFPATRPSLYTGESGDLKKDEMIVIPSQSRGEVPAPHRTSEHPAQPHAQREERVQIPISEPSPSPQIPSPAKHDISYSIPDHPVRSHDSHTTAPKSESAAHPAAGVPIERHSAQQRNVLVAHRPAGSTGRSSVPPHAAAPGGVEVPRERELVLPKPAQDTRNEKTQPHVTDNTLRIKDSERQRIEKELQRQRMVMISGRKPSTDQDIVQPQTQSRKIVSTPSGILKDSRHKEARSFESEITRDEPETKTVVVTKRKVVSGPPVSQFPDEMPDKNPSDLRKQSGETSVKEENVIMKNSRFPVKDSVFEGKRVPANDDYTARDSSLSDANLKLKRRTIYSQTEENE